MNYQEVVNTSGTHYIHEHLVAFKHGFKPPHCSDSLIDLIDDLKFNRCAEDQEFIKELKIQIPIDSTMEDIEILNILIGKSYKYFYDNIANELNN